LRWFARPIWLAALLVLASSQGVRAASAIIDQTGLMSPAAVSEIDARNTQLQAATGTTIAVLVEHGASSETAADAQAKAEQTLGQTFSVLVWVATDAQKADVVYAQPALRWLGPDEQEKFRTQLTGSLQFCCPANTVPAVVDTIAAAMENGSKSSPSPRNYVHDDLGLLDDTHLATIAAREQELESSRGLGVGVVLIDAAQGENPSVVALADAQSLNVGGNVAAVVWAARSNGSLSFDMISTPAYAGMIPDSTASNINATFQADMQSGQIGDAIAAAVDRTASALEASSTPVPAATPQPSAPSEAGAAAQPAGAAPTSVPTPAPAEGTSQASTALVILVGLALLVLIVTLAVRRRNR
jgi:uncharacterized membrane protein YgcG